MTGSAKKKKEIKQKPKDIDVSNAAIPKQKKPKGKGKKVSTVEEKDDDIIEVEDGKPSGKAKADSIPWEKNPAWIAKAIEFLTNNPHFRVKLYSDSTSNATTQGRAKLQGKTTKLQMYETMMDYVAGVKSAEEMKEEAASAGSKDRGGDNVAAETKSDGDGKDRKNIGVLGPKWTALYLADRERLKIYGTHVKTLYSTSGGLLPEDDQANLIANIQEKFVHWDKLHAFWQELPNYNPIVVTNAKSGGDHAKRAGNLFGMEAEESVDIEEMSEWKEHGLNTPSSMCAMSEGSSEAAMDVEEEEEDVDEKLKPAVQDSTINKKPKIKAELSAKAKKRQGAFNLDTLDESYQQDIAESSRRANKHLALELQKEENKRRKLDNDCQRLKMEREGMQAQMRQNQMVMGMTQQMMGIHRNVGMGAPMQGLMSGGNFGHQQNDQYHDDDLSSISSGGTSGFDFSGMSKSLSTMVSTIRDTTSKKCLLHPPPPCLPSCLAPSSAMSCWSRFYIISIVLVIRRAIPDKLLLPFLITHVVLRFKVMNEVIGNDPSGNPQHVQIKSEHGRPSN
ncbi:unnamed protein product [Mycena citricolor]|uniref:No apical meristem-associated C-terminal domain-containing protein n=1 Tax=Mycena citricolor TaxID=2018698 RepID=A0AAD2JZM1_9AGAR|nr:unnamed protein product [Mycena citricolor]